MNNIGSMVTPYLEQALQNIDKNNSNISLVGFFERIVKQAGETMDLPTLSELQNIDFSNFKEALVVLGITFIVVIFVCLFLYLFKAIGLYTMSKTNKKSGGWLAFVPYGCLYVLGKNVSKTKLYGIDIEHPEWLLPITLLSSMLPCTGILSIPLFFLFTYGLLYRLYQQKVPSFAVVLLLLSILVPLFIPIFIFAIRRK